MQIINYPTFGNVLKAMGYEVAPEQKKLRIKCPFCTKKANGKSLVIDLESEKFYCFKCGIDDIGVLKFFAYANNCGTQEAYHKISLLLGLEMNHPKMRTRTIYNPQTLESPVAPVEKRDKIYRAMLSAYGLSKKHKMQLENRGFAAIELKMLQYASFPGNVDFSSITVNNRIAKFLSNKADSLFGIPGIYNASDGHVSVAGSKPGIFIPCVNYYNQITALAIRTDDDFLVHDRFTGKSGSKYLWFTSSGYNRGCSVLESLHYACDFIWDVNSFKPSIYETIYITDSIVKADLMHCITGNTYLAVSDMKGFEQLRKDIDLLKKKALHTVVDAFNLGSAFYSDTLKAIASSNEIAYERADWPVALQGYEYKGDIFKGIDDYYAYTERGIFPEIKTQ